MQPRILITNGAPHSAETHAEATAWKVLDLIRIPEEPVARDNPDRAVIEAGREAARQGKAVLAPKLVALFTPHHQTLIDGERSALKQEGASRLARRRAYSDLVDETAVLAEMNAAFADTPFAAHFAQPDVQAVLRQMLDIEFDRVAGDEHNWFADEPVKGSAAEAHHDKYFKGMKRNGNDPALREFRSRRNAAPEAAKA